jgi:hypothetical protein
LSYYYRGTTRGWEGSSNSIELGITFVSTDPLVATLFAIECRNHGQPAVLILSKEVAPVLAEVTPERINPVDITFDGLERAVKLAASPSDLERMASYIVDVDDAIVVLNELGFEDIPVRIGSKSELNRYLADNYASGVRLSLKQIREFDSRIEGGSR